MFEQNVEVISYRFCITHTLTHATSSVFSQATSRGHLASGEGQEKRGHAARDNVTDRVVIRNSGQSCSKAKGTTSCSPQMTSALLMTSRPRANSKNLERIRVEPRGKVFVHMMLLTGHFFNILTVLSSETGQSHFCIWPCS